MREANERPFAGPAPEPALLPRGELWARPSARPTGAVAASHAFVVRLLSDTTVVVAYRALKELMVTQKLVTLAWPTDTIRLQRLLERCSDYYELHEGCSTPTDAGEHELTAVPPRSTEDDFYVFALEDNNGTLHAAAQVLRNYPDELRTRYNPPRLDRSRSSPRSR